MCGRYVIRNIVSKNEHLVNNPDNVLDEENYNAGQAAFMKRAKLNSLAHSGEYTNNMED